MFFLFIFVCAFVVAFVVVLVVCLCFVNLFDFVLFALFCGGCVGLLLREINMFRLAAKDFCRALSSFVGDIFSKSNVFVC